MRGAAAVLEGFAVPPPGYGPVPFWWWVGGTLDAERLCWQLDELRAKGVFSAIISYNHHADGTTNVGDPAIFSEGWWTILLAVLDHARAHGMTLGIQDYSLLKPRLNAIGDADPALRGAELRHVAGDATPERGVALRLPVDATLIEASAWADGRTIDLTTTVMGTALDWTPDAGKWQVAVVYTVPTPFDPLHPESGARSLAAFQEMIAARIGEHLGTTLTMFFQDELDFGARWPFWSAGLVEAFAKAKGYPLTGRLAELWCDRDATTTKFRLDFTDVAVDMLEAHYFVPVHRWHEANGCLFGHDNAGRGAVAVGRDFYGDYMRTMRWYSAPGSDDPDLRGERAFKGLKVASSIASLYGRPRVWAECFHSSGWGATPAEMLDGINGVFALGATVINLHGLYYTTAGSWWEWAPPDFHFRQPYWACMEAFNAYATRLTWLLSQGCHACDVAILYPSTALAGGLNADVDPALAGPMPLSEAQRLEAHPPVDAAEANAFAVARALFANGVDFDFIDDESIADAAIDGNRLVAGGGRWRTILLPEMTTIDWDTLCRLHAFAQAGGCVVAIGAVPRASNRAGSNDPTLDALVASLFHPGGCGIHLPDADPAFLHIVAPPAERDVQVIGPAMQIVHRRIDGQDIWFVRNPAPRPAEVDLILRGTGAAWLLDAFTGAAAPLASIGDGEQGSRVQLSVPASGAVVVLLDPTSPAHAVSAPTIVEDEVLTLEGDWRFALEPTMDNRFGDFAAPAGLVGADIRRFDWCEGTPDATTRWQTIAPGHAPRLLVLGPVSPDDAALWEATVATAPPGCAPPPLRMAGQEHGWRDYVFSLRDGLLEDPFLKHWASGPHGLKGAIPDDYIDLEGAPGDVWYLTGRVHVARPGPARIVVGSRAAYRLWADGTLLIDQAEALPPGRLPEWGLPHYDAPPREATVEPGARIVLRIVQPEGQRTRAHIGLADAPVPAERRLRWFADDSLSLEPVVSADVPQWVRFTVPPGATSLDLGHRGTVAAWRDGNPMTVSTDAKADQTMVSRITDKTCAARPTTVLLRIDAPGYRGGDCIEAPIALVDPLGPIVPGDWAQQGLAGYSGGVAYRRDFYLSSTDVTRALILETGPVHAVAHIVLNGREIGCVFAAPWRIALGEAVRLGDNQLEIHVFNTLANHYDQAVPTPYVFPGQTVSGLLTTPRIVAL